MTVIVGVLCEGGVVVGSDSSATFGQAGLNTIEYPCQKTFVVEPDVVLATTGAGGLGQRLHWLLQTLRKPTPPAPGKTGNPPLNVLPRMMAAGLIANRMLDNMRQTFLNPGGVGAIVAFPSADGIQLCEFAVQDFQPEFKTADTWFVSMGSGQGITDPFFGLLGRTLFRHSRPTLSEGLFAATWALENAINLNAGGINGPIQLATLTQEAGQPCRACLLGREDLEEHRENVRAIEEHLAGWRSRLSRSPQPTAGEPPFPEPPPAP